MTVPARRLGRFDRPDCSIAYEVTGAGPAVIFAHGLGGNPMSWFQQVAHFAPDYTCIAFAHRGFAPSSSIPGGPDPADYADDMAALVAHLGLTDFRIVAQSMGGWTSVEYALRRPAGLRGLVLAATTGTIDPKRIGAADLPALAAWEAASGPTLDGYMRAGIHPAAGARMAAEQPAMHLLYKHIDDQNAAMDKQALRLKLMHSRTRAPAELANIACPILLIANDEDAVIPHVAADPIAAMVANVRAVHIPDAGHSGYFERPALFNRYVREFFVTLG